MFCVMSPIDMKKILILMCQPEAVETKSSSVFMVGIFE